MREGRVAALYESRFAAFLFLRLNTLIEEQKKKLENIETRSSRVLFPLAHFRQIFDEDTFDVFVYFKCDYNLAEYLKKKKPTGETLRQIYIQTAERKFQ